MFVLGLHLVLFEFLPAQYQFEYDLEIAFLENMGTFSLDLYFLSIINIWVFLVIFASIRFISVGNTALKIASHVHVKHRPVKYTNRIPEVVPV